MDSAQGLYTKKIFDGFISDRFVEEGVCFLKLKINGDFNFEPGQYVWLIVENIDSDRQAFSIADYSEDKKEITIIFNLGLSAYKKIIQESPINSKVKVLGPFGQSVVFKKDDPRQLNFYAGGVGIAPFLSVIKSHSELKSSTKINLKYFTNKQVTKIIEKLDQFKSTNPNFSYTIIKKRAEFALSPDKNNLHCVVGSQEFVDYVSSKLTAIGINQKDVVYEQFYPSSVWKKLKYDFRIDAKNEFLLARDNTLSRFVPWMIILGIIFSLISGVQFYARGVLTGINITTTFLLILLGLYWYLSKNIKVISTIVTFLSMSLILYGLIFDPSSKFAIFWIPLVPVLTFIFKGMKSSSWNLAYLIIVYIYFSLVFLGFIEFGHEFLELINVVLSTTLIVALVYINSVVDNMRRIYQQDLLEKMTIFKQAVESSSNHIVITDENGSVLFANNAAQKITGFSSNEIIGSTPRLWGGEMDNAFYKTLWHKKTTGESVEGEIINRRKNGSLYTALAHISPIFVNNKILGYIGTEEDITKLKELDKLKDEFVSLASHELRTPMTAIKGFVSMILDGDYGSFTKELKEPLKNVQFSTERLINLVNDLLNVSRIESGRLKIDLEDIDIVSLTKEAVGSLKPIADDKKLVLKIDEQKLPLVQTDEDKFKQVLINLIGNSLKFTDKGYIKVSFGIDGDFVKVSVSDTGMGINKEDWERIFGKFEQVTSASKGKPQGTGLGLYICKMIIEKQGGRLWVENSEIGKGSVFSFTLPKSGSKVATDFKNQVLKEASTHSDQKGMASQ